jgi:hypothetical protein
VTSPAEVSAALRQIARGFDALADALGEPKAPEGTRVFEVLREWGERGLTRAEASALLRKHGFAPQTSGGWARGNWIESRADGKRYLTDRSRRWVAEQKESSNGRRL